MPFYVIRIITGIYFGTLDVFTEPTLIYINWNSENLKNQIDIFFFSSDNWNIQFKI